MALTKALRLNAVITARSVSAPAQPALVTYDAASRDSKNAVALVAVYPDDRVVRAVDGSGADIPQASLNDTNLYPDIVPAGVGSACELVRQQGVWVLRGTNEGVRYGQCEAPPP